MHCVYIYLLGKMVIIPNIQHDEVSFLLIINVYQTIIALHLLGSSNQDPLPPINKHSTWWRFLFDDYPINVLNDDCTVHQQHFGCWSFNVDVSIIALTIPSKYIQCKHGYWQQIWAPGHAYFVFKNWYWYTSHFFNKLILLE